MRCFLEEAYRNFYSYQFSSSYLKIIHPTDLKIISPISIYSRIRPIFLWKHCKSSTQNSRPQDVPVRFRPRAPD